MSLSIRARFLIDNLDLPAATGADDARWEHFQLSLWSDESPYRIEAKSRQIAWSWAIAADAVASAMLEGRDSIFVSINLEESKEKIRYADAIRGNLRISGLPRLARDTLTELEFDNGARITSLPAKPIRGRARANVYLDEFAHARDDRQIYIGSLPVTSKGGRLRIGSSPFGASGQFWEIYEEKLRRYPGYRRKATPWWEVYAFCVNVREARKVAPALLPSERVDRYGNSRIRSIYANMPEEDFRQEYECAFVDEVTAWVTWEEIRSAQTPDLHCRLVRANGHLTPEIFEAIRQTLHDAATARIEGALAVGVDVGRTRNATEIFIVGISTTDTYPLRLAITLESMDFDDQLSVLLDMLQRLPIIAMLIDQNGIGRNLAESAAAAYQVKVRPVDFTGASKALWATDAKMLISQHKTPLPVDRDIAYQLHSIKRIVGAGRNLIFDTERNEKHHADKFWAWALALAGARQGLAYTASQEELEAAFRWN